MSNRSIKSCVSLPQNQNIYFFPLARRGWGLLFAPGFCPASGVTFSCGRKNSKTTGIFFLNFNMTFLAKWGCASDFLKMLPKLQMAARCQLQKIFWAQKLSNLKSEIIQISLSHSPPYENAHVTFSKFY